MSRWDESSNCRVPTLFTESELVVAEDYFHSFFELTKIDEYSRLNNQAIQLLSMISSLLSVKFSFTSMHPQAHYTTKIKIGCIREPIFLGYAYHGISQIHPQSNYVFSTPNWTHDHIKIVLPTLISKYVHINFKYLGNNIQSYFRESLLHRKLSIRACRWPQYEIYGKFWFIEPLGLSSSLDVKTSIVLDSDVKFYLFG